MQADDVPLMAMLQNRMAWLGRRQTVLAQNVADASVPGYTPRDLKPMDFDQTLRTITTSQVSAGTLALTDPRHIASTSIRTELEEVQTPDVEPSPDGNSVSLQEEMIKISDTQAQYQAVTNLYAKSMSMMKVALDKAGV